MSKCRFWSTIKNKRLFLVFDPCDIWSIREEGRYGLLRTALQEVS